MADHIGKDARSSPQGPGLVARIAGKVEDQAGQVREAVEDFGRRTVGGIDGQRHAAAVTLDHTAVALHQQTDRVADLAHSTADQLQAAGTYVRRHDLKAMGRDVETLVRRYPAYALVGAAVIGFVIVRAVRTRA